MVEQWPFKPLVESSSLSALTVLFMVVYWWPIQSGFRIGHSFLFANGSFTVLLPPFVPDMPEAERVLSDERFDSPSLWAIIISR
jgi:hypothetical protein